MRERVAKLLENPRINAITFNTFRHWGATMTYHYTKNILLVQKLLGHKNIVSTMKYTRLVHFKDDKFDVATATTVEEAKDLAATGFEYFTTMNGVHIFRKPKMFQKYTQLVHFKDDEFHVATATTVEEAKELLATGFDYITEKNGIMLFRKPKTFHI